MERIDAEFFQAKPFEALKSAMEAQEMPFEEAFDAKQVIQLYRCVTFQKYQGSEFIAQTESSTRLLLEECINNMVRTSSILPLTLQSLEYILTHIGEENTVELLVSERAQDFLLKQTILYSLGTHASAISITSEKPSKSLQPFAVGEYIFPRIAHGLAKNQFCSTTRNEIIYNNYCKYISIGGSKAVWFTKFLNLEYVFRSIPTICPEVEMKSFRVYGGKSRLILCSFFIHAASKRVSEKLRKDTNLDFAAKPLSSFMDKLIYRQKDCHDIIQMDVQNVEERDEVMSKLLEFGWKNSGEEKTANGSTCSYLSISIQVSHKMNTFEFHVTLPMWIEIRLIESKNENSTSLASKKQVFFNQIEMLGKHDKYEHLLSSLSEYKVLNNIPQIDIESISDFNLRGEVDQLNPKLPRIKSASLLAQFKEYRNYMRLHMIRSTDCNLLDSLAYDLISLYKQNLFQNVNDLALKLQPDCIIKIESLVDFIQFYKDSDSLITVKELQGIIAMGGDLLLDFLNR